MHRARTRDGFGLSVLFFLVALALILYVALASVTPARAQTQEICAIPARVAAAVRAMGHRVTIVSAPETVAQALNFLKANGLPAGVRADALFLNTMADGLRLSFISDGCLRGMVLLDASTARELRRIVSGEAKGRSA